MAAVRVEQVEEMARQLSTADQLRLVEKLAKELRERQEVNGDHFPASASAAAAAKVLGAEDFSDWEGK